MAYLQITWVDGTGNVLTSGIDYMKKLMADNKRYEAKSILKLIPKMEYHNMTITCQAQNTADRTYKSAKLKLEVKFAPKVTVSVISGSLANEKIPEGTEIRLACQAIANPNVLTYRWFINGEPAIGDYNTEMILPNISRKYHDAIVKCEVQNAVGKSEASQMLDISYGPAFRSQPKSVEADVGSVATLSCDVDGNPAPAIEWIFNPSGKVRAPNHVNLFCYSHKYFKIFTFVIAPNWLSPSLSISCCICRPHCGKLMSEYDHKIFFLLKILYSIFSNRSRKEIFFLKRMKEENSPLIPLPIRATR